MLFGLNKLTELSPGPSVPVRLEATATQKVPFLLYLVEPSEVVLFPLSSTLCFSFHFLSFCRLDYILSR
jgi:hypothetical protein